MANVNKIVRRRQLALFIALVLGIGAGGAGTWMVTLPSRWFSSRMRRNSNSTTRTAPTSSASWNAALFPNSGMPKTSGSLPLCCASTIPAVSIVSSSTRSAGRCSVQRAMTSNLSASAGNRTWISMTPSTCWHNATSLMRCANWKRLRRQHDHRAKP